MKQPRWTDAQITQGIRNLNGAGVPLNLGYVQTSYRQLFGAGRKRYGSWREAVTASGINYDEACKRGRVLLDAAREAAAWP